ncbi:MAG TPA: DUF1844 domain-containing protein [Candidatus Aminicenantes bacterium]|nr:DUF1844 domain-containing protein [Candidatus Aminicenantes bacterium]HRY65349.1 DUF1844 domain-containing protein [Candidatus Aminicenantes bacterium]HRZ72183.1 DUF1844 domain-containing protein [Candidatus Aminicenantes bacterium]
MTPDDKTSGPANAPDFLPALEFSSIVILLYFPALVQLGLVEDPATGERRENLALAKRNIDLLDLLRDRTKDNLEDEEKEFLDGVLDQLKLAYLKKAEIVKI